MKNIWLLWLLLIIFAGCSAERAASRKLMRADRQSKYAVAEWCARLYPPVALIKDSISYLPGKTELVYVSVDCDNLPINNTSGRVITVPCPESKVVDTVLVYKERHIVNRAKLESQELLVIKQRSLIAGLRKHNKLLLVCVIVTSIPLLIRIIKAFLRFT